MRPDCAVFCEYLTVLNCVPIISVATLDQERSAVILDMLIYCRIIQNATQKFSKMATNMERDPMTAMRASVAYEKGSADYWKLRDMQAIAEMQRCNDDDDSDNEEGTPAEIVQVKKSRRKSNTMWATEESRIASTRLQELAEKDKFIDEQQQANRTIEDKYKRLLEEFEEEKRKHCLSAAENLRDLKEQDALLTTKVGMFNEEKRRRLCLEDEIRKLNERSIDAHNDQQMTLRKLSDLEMKVKESKIQVTNVEEEMTQKDAALVRLKENMSKLEIQLELSEAKRLETSRTNREVTARIEELQSVQDSITKLESRTEELSEAKKCIAILKAEHHNHVMKLTETFNTQLTSEQATCDALKVHAHQLEEKLKIQERPKEDNALRGQVDELRRENSRVREEKRNTQTHLNKANTEHHNHVMKLTETFNTQLTSEQATCDALKVHAHQLEEKLKIQERPKEDNALRGQVDELRRENSRVREEKRNTQTHLNKANTDLRRLTRKNEQLQKQVNEAQEQAALVPDLQKRVEDLTVQVNSLSVVYEPTAPSEQRLSTAKQEIERGKHQEQVLLKLSEERLMKLEEVKKKLAESEGKIDSLVADCDKSSGENTTLQATVLSLRSERDELLAAAKHFEAMPTGQDQEKSKDKEESTQLRKSVQEVTKRLREEVKETEALFPNAFGWKVQKGKGAVAWRIAPINSQGRASWKAELCVKQTNGKYISVASPMLSHFLKKEGKPSDDTDAYEAYEVITACAPDFVRR
eukprot:TRINITY_DN129_c0_g1_i1.p1 TRINITY_DN129_c0_g1~~TRINITY_DN129_c0_g1_i1.p1  ORF type:complete len:754 (+),score=171.48 TRINITY_DN129_c0_g1_i1:893-3154(+)